MTVTSLCSKQWPLSRANEDLVQLRVESYPALEECQRLESGEIGSVMHLMHWQKLTETKRLPRTTAPGCVRISVGAEGAEEPLAPLLSLG